MKKKKRGKIVSIPCFLMVAVPSFVLTLYDNEMIQLKDEEPWCAAYTIIMILVIVISLFQCGLRGIWIGPLRFVLGTFIGALGAVGWILLIGVLLVVGMAGGGSRGDTTLRINKDGRLIEIYPAGLDGNGNMRYQDAEGEDYTSEEGRDGYVFDRLGYSHMIV